LGKQVGYLNGVTLGDNTVRIEVVDASLPSSLREHGTAINLIPPAGRTPPQVVREPGRNLAMRRANRGPLAPGFHKGFPLPPEDQKQLSVSVLRGRGVVNPASQDFHTTALALNKST